MLDITTTQAPVGKSKGTCIRCDISRSQSLSGEGNNSEVSLSTGNNSGEISRGSSQISLTPFKIFKRSPSSRSARVIFKEFGSH